jgi:hypothetical protein
MNKRGAYFFVIDAFIAASIIFVTLMLIMNTHATKPESAPTLRMVEDYTEFLMNTKIREFEGPYTEILFNNHNITNLDNTLLDQLTEFYYYNSTGKNMSAIMADFTREISQGIVSSQRSFAVYINDSLIYNRTQKQAEYAELLLSSKKISYKRINDTYIYGPVIVRVSVWV